MNVPPEVNRLIMYKHGVAFVERGGPIDGDFDLTFRRDDMKDVLKSLSVTVVDGDMSVGTVGFDTPSDPRTELGRRNLLFESGEALLGLLDALRGRAVEVHCGDQRHQGEVIGVDGAGEQHMRRLLVIRAESGTVSLVDLADAHRVELLEEPSRSDLDYLIDRSRAATAGENRSMTVQVRGRADDARVSYIVPAPVWRVSYRVIHDGDTITLAAMAIVHNPLDEDLVEVALTLTTGQPVSFDIDLYHGKHVQRAVVEESERVALPAERHLRDTRSLAVAPAPDGYAMTGGAYEDAADDVEAAQPGEHFEYRLGTPVSLKRGGAAMVPLVVKPVDGVRRERVWRDGAEPAPAIVLFFANTTGVVLEEGPAVVYDQGGYAGEAMVPFTARGGRTRLSFAKDLAVRCRRTSTVDTVTARIWLTAEAVVEEQRQEELHTLHAENDHDEPVEVIFELFRTSGCTITSVTGADQEADDEDWHRFRVQVPAHGVAEATVLETWPNYRHVGYEELSPGQLEDWLAGRWLDAATVEALSDVLAHRAEATRLDEERRHLDEERDDLYNGQSRIGEQLRVLSADGAEGELRRRLVTELETMQDRVVRLEAEIRGRRDAADEARRAATDELKRVIAV
ncbi:hypothetical protein QGN32_04115 [Mycolicibacterium sp. ND9-15]|uniref:hypothetical protein n=1 Tax=Mycolicibacterium sp. ND9-15 TaxID=3042320 RepID=UPI002DDA5AD4|nr:hypothetical protein [Mycolicibacterium sp. ND9-15]WSE57099.1 hypothetical protein QGN32_04115 [Mycolicibacterium sp. ND9-15]